jgi:hypothetical protein
MTPRYRQRDSLSTRIVDGEAFVITRTTIKRLNPTATMIWAMLEEPMIEADIAAVMREVYPGTNPDQIESDVRNAIATLLNDNIAVEIRTSTA